ncbi:MULTISPECIES: hypothetical protein [Agrobacterium]|uniref:hypothetical protein n=1 Tax=Agrobacterium TaxID=357 RepID=UPI002300542C|nr:MULTISPECIES: hypothetical protein [Agrobacterium]MDA5636569.1 hypothetical protein [Agrobacterium sp. ST15.13.013]MDA6998707.1 hypothetical protein [Agrobacterium salinitolerans]
MTELAVILATILGGAILLWIVSTAVFFIVVICVKRIWAWANRNRVLTDEEEAALVQCYLNEGDAYIRTLKSQAQETAK